MTTVPVTPEFRLDGRRALVTGAGQGIGFALAAALAEAGASVTLAARTPDPVKRAAAAIAQKGGAATFAILDVTDREAVRAFFDGAPAFDIVVNNAGTNRPMPMQQVDIEDFDAVMDLNLRSTFFVSQAAARRMIASGISGSLIHISSQMGHVGGPNRSLYCASKWGVEGMSKAFALDLAPYRIRSNTIAPTFIETPMTEPFLADPAFRDSVLSRIKLGRLGRSEDLLGAVVFLASAASALMTGTSLVIDGGWTAE